MGDLFGSGGSGCVGDLGVGILAAVEEVEEEEEGGPKYRYRYQNHIELESSFL